MVTALVGGRAGVEGREPEAGAGRAASALSDCLCSAGGGAAGGEGLEQGPQRAWLPSGVMAVSVLDRHKGRA